MLAKKTEEAVKTGGGLSSVVWQTAIFPLCREAGWVFLLEQWSGLSGWQAASFSLQSPIRSLHYEPCHNRAIACCIRPPKAFPSHFQFDATKQRESDYFAYVIIIEWLTVSCKNDLKQEEREGKINGLKAGGRKWRLPRREIQLPPLAVMLVYREKYLHWSISLLSPG